MFSLTAIIYALSFSASCLAAGMKLDFDALESESTTFAVTQVKNPNWVSQPITTTEVYARSFLKHGFPMPQKLATAYEHLKSGTGSKLLARDVGMVESQGEYVYPVSIGTPAQTLSVLFDTGSSDFWVLSWLDSRGTPPSNLGVNYYNASRSTTAQAYGSQTFTANYVSGSVSGVVYRDVFSFDLGHAPLSISPWPIECAVHLSGGVSSLYDINGIFGLSRAKTDGESPSAQKTWLNALSPALPTKAFTVEMIHQGASTIGFGYIDTTKYTGSIVYTPAFDTSDTFNMWWFNTSGYAIGNGAFVTQTTMALADTGGNVGTFPPAMAAAYYAQVAGATQQVSDGSWIFPCSSTLPTFTFGLGSSRIVVEPTGFVLDLINPTTCYGSIQPGGNYIYFAEPFYYGTFVIHDYGNSRIGFATRTTL